MENCKYLPMFSLSYELKVCFRLWFLIALLNYLSYGMCGAACQSFVFNYTVAVLRDSLFVNIVIKYYYYYYYYYN